MSVASYQRGLVDGAKTKQKALDFAAAENKRLRAAILWLARDLELGDMTEDQIVESAIWNASTARDPAGEDKP